MRVTTFVDHLMKVLGSLIDTNQSATGSIMTVFSPVDPIVGLQLTSTTFPQSALKADREALNSTI
jgi:hypothetical protein